MGKISLFLDAHKRRCLQMAPKKEEEEDAGPMQGHHVVEHEDGSKYEGEFVDGKRCGQGVLTFAEEKGSYEGLFADGVAHGEGVYTWPHGGTIRGEWANGKHNGKALFAWPGGNTQDAIVFSEYSGCDPNDIM